MKIYSYDELIKWFEYDAISEGLIQEGDDLNNPMEYDRRFEEWKELNELEEIEAGGFVNIREYEHYLVTAWQPWYDEERDNPAYRINGDE